MKLDVCFKKDRSYNEQFTECFFDDGYVPWLACSCRTSSLEP